MAKLKGEIEIGKNLKVKKHCKISSKSPPPKTKSPK